MKARTHSRSTNARQIRIKKIGNAADAIGRIAAGMDIYILTFGQFSLMDAITALLEQTGPAHVSMATWTAAKADLSRTQVLVDKAEILSLRMLVDRSFISRQPDYCAHMRRLFGDECIRTARIHAKFVTIRNDKWHLAVRTSMNLNDNPRLENIEISDDPSLCGFLEGLADEVFSEQPAGEFNREFPSLEGISEPSPIRCGDIRRIGDVS